MVILHVAPNPFYVDRGSPVRTREQIRWARRNGHTCHVVSYHIGGDIEEAVVHRIPRVPWYRRLDPGANFHRFYLDLLLMATVLRVGRRIRPDVIHAHLHEGVFASLPLATLAKLPVLMDAEGSLTEEMRAYAFPFARSFLPLERFLNGKASTMYQLNFRI